MLFQKTPYIRYQTSAVILIIFAFFSPSIFAEFCVIDDLEMIGNLRGVKDFDLAQVFIPRGTQGLYYRPVIALSFLFDYFVFNLNPVLMHLHNVFIHVANAVLVLWIGRNVAQQTLGKTSLLPLAMALLFGLHPITTESVNWVSGRTDLLSGFFILSATLFLLKYRTSNSPVHVCAAVISMILAVLTKEFALAFLPAAAMLLAVRSSEEENKRPEAGRGWIVISAMFIIVIILFALLRSMAFTSNSSRLALTLQILFVDYIHTLKVSMGAFAFYLKKIFVPWPLNFAIVEIDPLYELLAIPLLVICLRGMQRFTMQSVFFLSGIMLYAPAFLIAFNQIAWTPYAERYAYLSAAYIMISACLYVFSRWGAILGNYLASLIFLLICVFAWTTLERNLVWQTNYGLVNDMAQKTPDDANICFLYGAQLAERGHYDEAVTAFKKGKKLSNLGYDERFDLNLAEIYQEQRQMEKAEKAYEEAMRRSNGKSRRVVDKYVQFLEKKMVRTKKRVERVKVEMKIMELKEL